jgi:hypothetical protein
MIKYRKVKDPLDRDTIIRCEILNEQGEVIARVYKSKDRTSVENAKEVVLFYNIGYKLQHQ